MKIYTRTGDDGTTGLFGGGRVSKSSLRVEAYGTVDEANATIGRARVWLRTWAGTTGASEARSPEPSSRLAGASSHASVSPAQEIDAVLAPIQSDLFTLGSELATPADKDAKLALKTKLIEDEDCARLERAIDAAEEGLAPLKNFVLPGGTAAAAELHAARCVVRRAERLVVALAAEEAVRGPLVVYLNRLSDLLFTLARRANHLAGEPDVPWRPRPV
jgi:cob(I)alamin adenosyltransferase